MKVVTSKSKNAESFYISKSYINDKGASTSVIISKLGTLNDLLKEHGPTRDDVMRWAREDARIETQKYKEERQSKTIQIPVRYQCHSLRSDLFQSAGTCQQTFFLSGRI